jgi:hypothetical protein
MAISANNTPPSQYFVWGLQAAAVILLLYWGLINPLMILSDKKQKSKLGAIFRLVFLFILPVVVGVILWNRSGQNNGRYVRF